MRIVSEYRTISMEGISVIAEKMSIYILLKDDSKYHELNVPKAETQKQSEKKLEPNGWTN